VKEEKECMVQAWMDWSYVVGDANGLKGWKELTGSGKLSTKNILTMNKSMNKRKEET